MNLDRMKKVDTDSALFIMFILRHVTEEKVWEVIEGGCTAGFTDEQRRKLIGVIHEAHLICIRALERQGPEAFCDLEEFSTYK